MWPYYLMYKSIVQSIYHCGEKCTDNCNWERRVRTTLVTKMLGKPTIM